MEVGRGAMDGAESAVGQGWPFARPAGAITLKMPQAPEGLSSRKKTFCFRFGSCKNVGPRQGRHVSRTTAHRSPGKFSQLTYHS